MFKSSAEIVNQVEELLENIKTLDLAGFQKMAEGLQRDVKKTAGQVKEIYDDLRYINSELAKVIFFSFLNVAWRTHLYP